MSLQIRMFGPMTEKKKELHNLLTELGYPIYIDFLHKEDKQWRLDNKETSYFFFIDGNGSDEWMWQCIDEDPDFQITPPLECLRDGHEPILEWLDRLVEGVVVVYPHCPPPEKQLLELPVFEQDPGPKEYELETRLVNDFMFYQVKKPFVDRPYTTVVRGFEKNGHKRFFTNLFVCNSWGVASKDIQFLYKAWEWFGMEGEFDLDAMMKEATDACKYPGLEPEPEVWRSDLQSVLEIFNKRSGFYSGSGVEYGRPFMASYHLCSRHNSHL